MADETVLEINLRAGTATFRGDMKQAQQIVEESMMKVRAAGQEANRGFDMSEAKGSLALISEELGVKIPRHLRGFIAEMPGVGKALNLAFSSVAVLALAEVVAKVVEKVQALREEAHKQQEEWVKFGDHARAAMLEAQAKTLELDIKIAKLTKNDGSVSVLEAKLQNVKDILGTMKVSEELKKQIKDLSESLPQSHWYLMGLGASGNQRGDLSKIQEEMDASGDSLAARKKVAEDWLDVEKIKLHGLNANDNQKEFDATIRLSHGLEAIRDELQKKIELQGKDHLATELADQAKATEKLNKEFDKLVEKMREFRGNTHFTRQLPDLTNVNAADPTGQFRGMLGAGDILKMMPPQQNPLYSGSSRAMDLEKIKTDQAAAVAATQKITEEVLSENDAWKSQMQILQELHSQGKLVGENYDKAFAQIQSHLTPINEDWKKFGTNVATTLEQAALFGRSWTDVVKTLGIQLVELTLKMTLFKDVAGSGKSGGGGFWGGIVNGLLNGGGPKGHARGGMIGAGEWGVVGEEGPELAFGGIRGVDVIPNSMLGGGGSGGSLTIGNMDLRGSNLTRHEVEAMVMKGVQHATKAAVHAMYEKQKRS